MNQSPNGTTVLPHLRSGQLGDISERGAVSVDPRYAPRLQKARKILEILQDYLGADLGDYQCLDLGCGEGIISNLLAQHCQAVTGMDLDIAAVQIASDNRIPNADFSFADGGHLPVPDGSFDVVVCAQVYEHAYNQIDLASEVWRVLRPGGICFFSGPNKLAVVEEHYWLPFLSWLPQSFANGYMMLFGRGTYYDVMPLSYWSLRRLWGKFEVTDYTSLMLREPERFGVRDKLGKLSMIGQLPHPVLKLLLPLMPNFNWILTKSYE